MAGGNYSLRAELQQQGVGPLPPAWGCPGVLGPRCAQVWAGTSRQQPSVTAPADPLRNVTLTLPPGPAVLEGQTVKPTPVSTSTFGPRTGKHWESMAPCWPSGPGHEALSAPTTAWPRVPKALPPPPHSASLRSVSAGGQGWGQLGGRSRGSAHACTYMHAPPCPPPSIRDTRTQPR